MRPLFLGLVALQACTPSYDGAREQAADVYCRRSLDCGWIEDDDVEDCLDDAEDTFEDAWPEEECKGDIDAEGYDDCLEAMEDLDCDDWLDFVEAFDECSSDEVCE